ncbi:MAG TPA: PilZ domain-containing protein [Candidatus Saccharimonadales bacterium]|nr:PilZ domain-containing protein [Candidatus Saccharimonadales bacterium]
MAFDPEENSPFQRKSPRYMVDLPVRITFNEGDKVVSHFGTGTNISEDGMRVFVPRDLEMGKRITLELRLPYNREELMMQATVRNRVNFEYGVEFVDAKDEEREAIRRNCRVLNLLR